MNRVKNLEREKKMSPARSYYRGIAANINMIENNAPSSSVSIWLEHGPDLQRPLWVPSWQIEVGDWIFPWQISPPKEEINMKKETFSDKMMKRDFTLLDLWTKRQQAEHLGNIGFIWLFFIRFSLNAIISPNLSLFRIAVANPAANHLGFCDTYSHSSTTQKGIQGSFEARTFWMKKEKNMKHGLKTGFHLCSLTLALSLTSWWLCVERRTLSTSFASLAYADWFSSRALWIWTD